VKHISNSKFLLFFTSMSAAMYIFYIVDFVMQRAPSNL